MNPRRSSVHFCRVNHLIAVTAPGETWAYAYDAFGNLISATHNGQRTDYVIDTTGSIEATQQRTDEVLAAIGRQSSP